MLASATAEILQFPVRGSTRAPADAQLPPEATPAQLRLSRALIGLNEAVEAQREAVAAWKSALSELRTVTGRLGETMRTYHDNLGHLDTKVKTLRTESLKLEAWADTVQTNQG